MAVSAQGDNLQTGPFSGLEDRFNANASKLYNAYTTRDRGDGTIQDQPFLEYKPNDPNANAVATDSRFAPIASTARDVSRLGKFLTSQEGITFLTDEELQQTGNTFSETRLIDPAFVIGNAVPYLHLERSFSDATQIPFINTNGDGSPASLDPNIGMAGRLQQYTAADAVSNVVGANASLSGLLASLSPVNLLASLAGAVGIGPSAGPEGVDQRPELNVNGQWYAIMLWQGFQKQTSVVSNLAGAINQLASGNVFGAIGQAVSGISSLINGAPNLQGVSGVLTGNRSDPNNTEIDGSRYFITTPDTVDRYLQNSISYTVNSYNDNVPVVTLGFLDRLPYLLPAAPTPAPLFQNVNTAGAAFSNSTDFASFLNQTNTNQQASTQNVLNNIRSPFQNISNIGNLGNTSTVSAYATFQDILITDSSNPNPAEQDMLFSNLSLDQRYQNPVDANIVFIQNVLQQQQQYEQTYWAQNQPSMGFVGGLQPTGQPAPIDPQSRNQNTTYFHDRLNEVGVVSNAGTNVISQQVINNIQQNFGTDLVNVLFYDYVNQKMVPFRAFITNIQENAIPEIDDTRYIGRIDRNVVYKGVTRELSFALYIHAMNDSEMTNVWSKINYLTGMVFPAAYSNGYMVPPLLRLTIGDYYRDTPGYIRSLTHQIEPDTPWETMANLQAPHGVLTTITFSVIERAPAQAGYQFYPFGTPRTTSPS